ncbi:hypothetical protein EON65_29895 [archaeon]|nr:MAG: hypothetical protein EON65_29895 [archaeon]
MFKLWALTLMDESAERVELMMMHKSMGEERGRQIKSIWNSGILATMACFPEAGSLQSLQGCASFHQQLDLTQENFTLWAILVLNCVSLSIFVSVVWR